MRREHALYPFPGRAPHLNIAQIRGGIKAQDIFYPFGTTALLLGWFDISKKMRRLPGAITKRQFSPYTVGMPSSLPEQEEILID